LFSAAQETEDRRELVYLVFVGIVGSLATAPQLFNHVFTSFGTITHSREGYSLPCEV
jgi:hypothetical protein